MQWLKYVQLELTQCCAYRKLQRAWYRNITMYGFHFLVDTLCVKGIRDTQCGFKLFTRKAAHVLFTDLHIERWYVVLRFLVCD